VLVQSTAELLALLDVSATQAIGKSSASVLKASLYRGLTTGSRNPILYQAGTLPDASARLPALGGAGHRPREPAIAKRVDDLFAVDMGALDATLVGVPLADLLGVDPATRKVRAYRVDF